MFYPRDFADLGGRPTIDSVLHRLAQKGKIRRTLKALEADINRGRKWNPPFTEVAGDQRKRPTLDGKIGGGAGGRSVTLEIIPPLR